MTTTATDLRHGRRGGGWQTTTARQALAAIGQARQKAGDDWPEHADRTSVFDRDHATVDDWEGRARMAHARRAAGVPLDDIDLEALDHYPKENPDG